MSRFTWVLIWFISASILAACSGGSSPELIASYPSAETSAPKLISGQEQIVYNAYLDLEVADPIYAARRAQKLAEAYGGYLSNSQTWQQSNKTYTTVTLAVPVYNFDRLRQELLDLGTIRSESVTGELIRYGAGGEIYYSQISLNFQPRAVAWVGSGQPGRALARAVMFFRTAFLSLLDISLWLLELCGSRLRFVAFGLTWLVVVFGPFFLAGWIGWKLARRAQKTGS